MLDCTFGQVDLTQVLGASEGEGVAELGIVDEHKAAVTAARLNQGTAAATDSCTEPACTDPTHDHSHSSHNHAADACDEPACTDPTHDHSHSSHNHGADACDEPACTDPTHDHSHSSHNHANTPATTAAARFGIKNFVYSSRRPFAPERLNTVLKLMPTSENNNRLLSETLTSQIAEAKGVPLAEASVPKATSKEGNDDSDYPDASAARDALSTVVRSKGFCWLAHSHAAACYWSHSGSHAELQLIGRWWATVPEEQWPEFQAAAIKDDFDGVHGDRRQEVVFIGADMTDTRRGTIEKALNWATLTDEELEEYNDNVAVPGRLATLFSNPIYLRPAGPVA